MEPVLRAKDLQDRATNSPSHKPITRLVPLTTGNLYILFWTNNAHISGLDKTKIDVSQRWMAKYVRLLLTKEGQIHKLFV